MKRAAYIIIFSLSIALSLAGCVGGVDYNAYISEKRTDIYLYEEDGLSFKIHCAERETPYNTDGIKGETCRTAEIMLTPSATPTQVSVSVGGHSGEMSYLSVSKSFYLSFTLEEDWGERVQVTLTVDGEEKSFTATSVLYDGVISAEQALKCVTEYDGALFDSLTDGRAFAGEIHVRLLYDDGCYFYVGVCDREGSIYAYLVDGETGRVIAKRTTST